MFLLDGKVIQPGTHFSHNGITYPPQWLYQTTLAEKEAIGIIEVPDPVRADDRFYWDGDINNPKDLDGLKIHFVEQIKYKAGTFLSPTDWTIIRKTERNIDIPDEIVAQRAAIIAEANRLENDINATETVEDLIEVLNVQNWGN